MDMAIGVVIETPKESRLKFKLDPATGAYKVDRILPKGLRFPFNFGFIPQTRAPDGDSTDVLLILDEILFPGCAVDCRALGVIRTDRSGIASRAISRVVAHDSASSTMRTMRFAEFEFSATTTLLCPTG